MTTFLVRDIALNLAQWKTSSPRKPLILRGARQTGKSFALTEFGAQHFKNYHLLNFQEYPELSSIFEGSLSPIGIVEALEIFLDKNIDPSTDLLIFDEIQDCPRAVTSIKYFYEKMPELALCCAGSLLGVVHSESPFPVGKVTFLDLYPLTFKEFVNALDETRMLAYLEKIGPEDDIAEFIHEDFLKLLREYFIVGGMPEVVDVYRRNREHRHSAFEQVRVKQSDLLDAYIRDFAKYADSARSDRILAVFTAIPAQLAKDNKKFIASKVTNKGRYSMLESAIDWLAGAGLIIKVPIANSGELPFSAFTAENRFKLYFFDTGLLGALSRLSPAAIFTENDLFATFKGAFCENFVAQEFRASSRYDLYSWASNTAEIEFMLEVAGQVLPVEVKSGKSGKLKSLNVFTKKHAAPYRTRFSSRNLEINREAAMHSYPLYLSYRFPLSL